MMILSAISWKKHCRHLILLPLIMTSSMLWAQTIVVLGDIPYSNKEKQMLQGPDGILFKLVNKANPSIVMHLGDFKAGHISCTDMVLKEHKTLLHQVYPGKLIYTPGDNDWTDCDRSSLPDSFNELERLDFLIKLMYQTPPLLDKELTSITVQPAQIENKLWINERLAISTIHLVGTSNGRTHIDKSNPALALKKVNLRDILNLAWLKKIAEKSAEYDALIIGFQADIYQQKILKRSSCSPTTLKECDAFTDYRQAFKALAKRIDKPVLVTHGDTGDFCFEKLDDNLWHLNAAGDFRYLDATKIIFNNESLEHPFTVSGLINTHLPTIGCDN